MSGNKFIVFEAFEKEYLLLHFHDFSLKDERATDIIFSESETH